MDAVTDLDAMLPSDKPIKLGGKTYLIPGDMPLVTFLRVNEVNDLQGQEDVSSVTVLGRMVDALVDLIAWHLPEGDADARATIRDDLQKHDMSFMANLLTTLYPGEADEALEDQADEVPPPSDPATGGTTTSS